MHVSRASSKHRQVALQLSLLEEQIGFPSLPFACNLAKETCLPFLPSMLHILHILESLLDCIEALCTCHGAAIRPGGLRFRVIALSAGRAAWMCDGSWKTADRRVMGDEEKAAGTGLQGG